MTRRHRALLLCCSSLLAASIPAIAATPEEGTISSAAPRVEWKGETVGGALTTLSAIPNGGTIACEAPSCDSFALKLAEAGDLTVTASSDNDRKFVLLEIEQPDGTVIYNGGAETDSSSTTKIKKAPAGDYTVRVANNAYDAQPYTAFAQLGTGAPPASGGTPNSTSPPAPAPTPEPTGGEGGSKPAPASPAAVLTLNTKKLSARKVKKAPKLSVSTSSPVTEFTAQLKKGKKTLGTAKLAKLEKSATVKVKLKKGLKKGSYTVVLRGKDSQGRIVGSTTKLKVAK